jgi:hypothetical protein
MKRLSVLFAIMLTAFGCAHERSAAGWVTLLDGTDMNNFNRLGDANWRVEDGAVVADKGNGFLVTHNSYQDFQIRAEFWANDEANSGIFIRVTDPQKVSSKSSYEVNIYDQRPDPTYGTAAIVDFAKVSPMPKAGGKWNTFLITAKGTNLVVVFNGVQTVNINDGSFPRGPFALQYGGGPGGVIKFRKVEVRPL